MTRLSEGRPTKKAKLLDDSDSEESSDNESGGVLLNRTEPVLKVNADYARRFEHNQKRAELHRLEEKFGKSQADGRKVTDDHDGDESSSDEEDEDDDGFLASGVLDEEVNATLNALKSKDPRVYDKETLFYTVPEGEDVPTENQTITKEKPVFLKDYHRQNLLRGESGGDEAPQTYAQEQESLRQSLVKEMHAAADGDSEHSESEQDAGNGEADFLVKKTKAIKPSKNTGQSKLDSVDVENADKDPEGFLSKFLGSKGWIAPSGTTLHPFESDDEEEETRADEFEQAYNLRFENPDGANEKLVSHARDAAAKYSVRQEPVNKRKRARETEKSKKEEEKSQRTEEKARLRKLRLEEANEKMKRIKEAAGLGNKPLDVEEWQDFLTEDWEDGQWETEMKRRFGDDYYAQNDNLGDEEEEVGRKHHKKPKWDDDIDINDLVPDFEMDEKETFSLSDEDGATDGELSKSTKTKQQVQLRKDQKYEARKEKRKLEKLVDDKLDAELALGGSSGKGARSIFQYRETSPSAFGMTAKDILMATDSQLNQYAGLKKMATFRDAEKKQKDKKKLGKKARLRQWRKDTFGHEDGPRQTLQDLLKEQEDENGLNTALAQGDGVDIREGKRRKRSKKSKA